MITFESQAKRRGTTTTAWRRTQMPAVPMQVGQESRKVQRALRGLQDASASQDTAPRTPGASASVALGSPTRGSCRGQGIAGKSASGCGPNCAAAAPTIPSCSATITSAIRADAEPVATRMVNAALGLLRGMLTPELAGQLQNSFSVATQQNIQNLITTYQAISGLIGRVTYYCAPQSSGCCDQCTAFVASGQRPNAVFVCPSFLSESATAREGQPFTIIHELAHLAGINGHAAELKYFSAFTATDCGALGIATAAAGMDNADSYPHFGACADIGLTPVITPPAPQRPQPGSLIEGIIESQSERMRQRVLESASEI